MIHILYGTSNTHSSTLRGFYYGFFAAVAALLSALASFVVRFPISQPQPRRTLTTFGVSAAVSGTRMKMKDLWIA